MIRSLRIIAVSSALAAVMLAVPLAQRWHTHAHQSCCASATSDCAQHGHDHGEHQAHHDHGSHPAHSHAPADDSSTCPTHDDCAVCQALGMAAISTWQVAVEFSGEQPSPWLFPTPQDASQTIRRAYQQRGPPQA